MGMVPEAAVAMLACARIGAPHSVVFGGFSADALRDRINDCGAKVLLTQDGAWRRGNVVPLKKMADVALEQTPSIEKVVVLRRVGHEREPVVMKEGRDVWWDDLLDARRRAPASLAAREAARRRSTPSTRSSSSTRRARRASPRASCTRRAGYLAGAHVTTKYVFDLRDDDVYWCTADVGWVTGHSYIVYGPLSCGATCMMYEGAPNFPDWARFWSIIERHGVTILYTAPTAIRAFIRAGDEWPKKHDLSSLRLLGSVGEPINPEAWIWYHRVIGGERCPIVDTWWQTETGSIMLTTLPGAVFTKPGSTGLPFFGVDIAVVKDRGEPCGAERGRQARHPAARGRRWRARSGATTSATGRRTGTSSRTCTSRATARGATQDGYFWVVGRIDDVLNVAGHRIGTAEIESALVSHPAVAEAAAVGRPDELKGQALVRLRHAEGRAEGGHGAQGGAHGAHRQGDRQVRPARRDPLHRLAARRPAAARSCGACSRRSPPGGETKGDTSTLEDLSVLAKLRADEE